MPMPMSSKTAGRPKARPATTALLAELVNKIERSPSPSGQRKRRSAARKKLNAVLKQQRRYAKNAKLRAVAVTLTYRDSAVCSRKHISAFFDRLRLTLKRMGHILPYAWVLERAGQLHYHSIIWLPRRFKLDLAKIGKWWPWGSTWVQACRSVQAWGRYIAKCDSTAEQRKGSHLYGYGGLDDTGKAAVSRATMPRWLASLLPAQHRVRRCPGGGWMDLETGEIYLSPYVWTPWGVRLLHTAPLPIAPI